MAKTKKKARKKPAKKPTRKKAARRKPAARKKAARGADRRGGFQIAVTPQLDARLRALAANLTKSMDELLLQALVEFAETWEDHLQTVAALKESEDRVQLSVPKE